MVKETVKKCLLNSISRICSDVQSNKNISPLSMKDISEQKLIYWIEDTSEIILNGVIPDIFWSDFKLSKPTYHLSRLCKKSKDMAINVLDLVLWSCCSQPCNDEIRSVLDSATEKWDNCRKYQIENVLQIYGMCVQGHVWYSIWNLNINDNVQSITKETPVLKEAYCLHAAVVNSSAIFRILSYTTQSPSSIVMAFVNFLKKSNPVKAPSRALPCILFAENDSDNVNHVSIAKWFKRDIICPSLRTMFKFKMVQLLSNKLEEVLCKSGDIISNTDLIELNQLARQCAQYMLCIDCSPPDSLACIRLITYTVLIKGFLENGDAKEAGLSYKDEMLITKLLQSCVLRKDNLRKGLKNLVENCSMPHFNESFLKTLVLNKFELPDFQWKLLVGKVDGESNSQLLSLKKNVTVHGEKQKQNAQPKENTSKKRKKSPIL